MQCGIDTTEKGFQAICEGGKKKDSWFGIWKIGKESLRISNQVTRQMLMQLMRKDAIRYGWKFDLFTGHV